MKVDEEGSDMFQDAQFKTPVIPINPMKFVSGKWPTRPF
jgi:hypothetical protein